MKEEVIKTFIFIYVLNFLFLKISTCIQSALHVSGFCICSFNQPEIKNIWENARKFQKARHEFAMYPVTIYIA